MRGFRFIFLSLVILSISACSGPTGGDVAKAPEEKPEPPPPPSGDPVVTIQTIKGDIVVRLRPDLAPTTAERFKVMAMAGFYNRSTFHYVSKGFIQGGDPFSKDNDPYNDGKGNAAEWITPEFREDYEVGRGAVGMMRKDTQPDSSSCQFFIVLRRKKEWDGKYNIFGEVIEGIETADAIGDSPIVKNDRKLNNHPTAKMTIKKMKVDYREFPEEAATEATEG
jgi:cyclophilin family peptidyl-prolyl cis-trans isomerase